MEPSIFISIQIKMDYEMLQTMTRENTEFMSLKNKHYDAKIVHIYDGDTMHVVFYEYGQYIKWNCRVMGVDTPEIRTRNLQEKQLGLKVRDILIERLLNKIVKIHTDEFDKYGRLLIDVEMPLEPLVENQDSIMLSEWLIANNYAYPYEGGTKRSWVFE